MPFKTMLTLLATGTQVNDGRHFPPVEPGEIASTTPNDNW